MTVKDGINDAPMGGTRTSLDVYGRFNVVVLELVNFEEVAKSSSYKQAFEDEIEMIEKHHTLKLANRPSHKHVIG